MSTDIVVTTMDLKLNSFLISVETFFEIRLCRLLSHGESTSSTDAHTSLFTLTCLLWDMYTIELGANQYIQYST